MDTLLSMGLTNALLATGLALGVAVLSLVCRRPALLHTLWLLVLLKLVTPPLLPLQLPWPDGTRTALPRSSSAPVADVDSPSPPRNPETEADLSRTHIEPERVRADPPRLRRWSRRDRLALSPVPRPEEATESHAAVLFPWQAVVGTVWLTGCLAWWTIAAWRIARFRRLLRHATPAPPALLAQARRLGLARCPRIDLVPAPLSPLLWALGNAPRLLLPAPLWDRLTGEQQQTLLAHELAHLHRRDHWVRRLELLVLGLYWWHPAAWWARRRLHDAEEQCCDAWVVWALPAAAPAYASALVETVAFLSLARPALPLAASGAGHVRTLKRRLTMILGETPPRALSRPGLLAVLVVGALLLPLLPTPAQPSAREVAPDKAQPGIPKSQKPVTADTAPAKPAPERAPAKPAARDVASKPVAIEASAPAKPAAADRSAQIEALTDDIELLEVQLEGKMAEVKETAVRLEQAQQNVARLTNLGKAASEQEVANARAEAQIREARLLGKRAQVAEVQIRLKQARRRLARLKKQPADPAARPESPVRLIDEATRTPNHKRRAPDQDRLQKLEQKLQALLKEVEAMRKSANRTQPRDPAAR